MAEAYVRFIGALEFAREPWLSRACREFGAARLLPDAVPTCVLRARAARLALELISRARELDAALRAACLISEERSRAREVLRELERDHRLMSTSQHWTLPQCSDPADAAHGMLLDLDHAYQQLSALGVMSLSSPRALTGRLRTVRSLRIPASTPPARTVVFLDRVDFACYSLGAYAPGWSRLAPWARRGRLVLGALREAGPLVEALGPTAGGATAFGAMAGVLAALGLLDDTPSRDALVAFLDAAAVALERGRGCDAGMMGLLTGASIEAAVIGLAKRPVGGLATELRPAEEQALRTLEKVARDAGRSDLATLAHRSRVDWTSGSLPRELMML